MRKKKEAWKRKKNDDKDGYGRAERKMERERCE